MELRDDKYCFACGKQNPIGLKLEFQVGEDGMARGTFRPAREHQGYAGVVHGGILATLADECMAYLLISRGMDAVTATLEMKYKRPAHVGEELLIEARLTEARGKIYRLEVKISDELGLTLAEGHAVFMKISR